MKVLIIPAMMLLFIICSCSNNNTTAKNDSSTQVKSATTTEAPSTPAMKKYDIKSGVITYKTTVNMGGTKIEGQKKVYFDDYGMKEAEETLNADGTVKETFMSDGKKLWLLLHDKKEAYDRGNAYRGVAFKVDFNEFSSADKASGKVKKVADVTVAGKPCETFEMKDENTKTNNTFAGWNHIMMMMKQTGPMTSITEAVKLEENVPVPAEKFQVPPGYASKKM